MSDQYAEQAAQDEPEVETELVHPEPEHPQARLRAVLTSLQSSHIAEDKAHNLYNAVIELVRIMQDAFPREPVEESDGEDNG